MAAYEDFEYFRSGMTSVRAAPPSSPVRPDRDALHRELARLHDEVTRLRAKVRNGGWPTRLRRLVARLVPQQELHESATGS